MKSFIKNLSPTVLTLVVLVVMSSFSIGNNKGKEGETTIVEASQKLEQAIDSRKFAEAKEAVNEIIPWMKQDIKTDKKTLSQIGKSIDETEINKKDFKTTLNKKNELYESTKHIVETSPAAIRVKGKALVKLVNEYVTLVE